MTALYATYIIIVIIILIELVELLSFRSCALHTHTLILNMRISNKCWLRLHD